MRSSSIRALVVGLVALPAALHAQGTLSTQGFGYPGGQMSTRALGAGGALAESDPFSATNPASIFNFGTSILYFQAEPEYRTVRQGAQTEHATIARYPLVVAGVPIGESFYASLSASNLLDRSFSTSGRSVQQVAGESIGSTDTFTSDGAIGDVRLALAWAPLSWLHVGGAGHVITGDNRLNSTQVFDDTARFAAFVDTQTVTYTGTAYSAGVDLLAGSVASFSASYRHGGPLSIKRADTTLRTGHVPDRIAFGAAFVGIRGTTIGIRTSKDSWSNLASLTTTGVRITDAWDTSVGADVLGPRVLGAPVQLRAGIRSRTLPFGTPRVPLAGDGFSSGSDVKESSYSFGLGSALGRGHAGVDMALVHASRTATGSDVTEKAWTLSVGISVRP